MMFSPSQGSDGLDSILCSRIRRGSVRTKREHPGNEGFKQATKSSVHRPGWSFYRSTANYATQRQPVDDQSTTSVGDLGRVAHVHAYVYPCSGLCAPGLHD